MTTLFWMSAALIVFAYAGYPLFLRSLGAVRPAPVNKGGALPKVTLVTACHNERQCIAASLENKLALDYPSGQLEIIVVSDASTDGTDEIAKRYQERGVQFLRQSERLGKTAALNLALQHATGEIIVFSDANSLYQTDVLRMLVRNFADPKVGYVTGRLVYVDETGSVVGSGSSAYMRYENRLREIETNVGSIVGVDGAVDAVRASLYTPIPENLLPDFALPLKVVESGSRVVYEPDAVMYEVTLREVRDELKMRVRVILRSLHTMWHMRGLFNPFRHGLFSFQLFVHKVLRYLVGPLQVIALVANALSFWHGPIYQVAMASQLFFYASALTGLTLAHFRKRVPVFYYSYYLCLLNGASVLALWKFMKGEQIVVWAPRTG